MSLRKEGCYKYKDEDGVEQEMIVDELFTLSKEDREAGNTVEWFWVNEPWEGTKIGFDMYLEIKPKVNQRRKLDNPYYTRLGYSGLIYNSTNSISVSLVDRLKPYQYLYNIIMYRMELAFASDMGKVMLMDLAQIPRSEGIDVEQWMYYLKAMKIGFVNSFEEGKGKFTGQKSTFNQFQSIDMSLTNTIQQYINTLNYIRQQIFFLSGVDLTRLGQSAPDAGLGTSQMNLQQSANVTRPWVEGHNFVKERVYTALLECAKIAYREGMEAQFVLDDLSIDMVNVDGPEFENSEFGVFVSNSARDAQSLQELKQLFQAALQADKANLSDIAKVLQSDSMSDLTRMLERKEMEKAQAQEKQAEAQQQHEKEIQKMQLDEKQADRDLEVYKTDANNSTKITVAEIGTYFQAPGTDDNANGTPDMLEIASLELEKQKFAHEALLSKDQHSHEKKKHEDEIALKEKELMQHKELETKKLKAEDKRTNVDKKIATKDQKLAEKELKVKEQIEKIKLRASKNKSKK